MGERRHADRRISDTEIALGSAFVGYAVRADALVEQWPQLFGAATALAELCLLPPDTPEWTPDL